MLRNVNNFSAGLKTSLLSGVFSAAVLTTAQAEDRVLWVSVGDSLNSSSSMTAAVNYANANNFNAIAVLARYRTNRSYLANRDFNTYTNTEPTFVGGFDTIQHVIDRVDEINLNNNKNIRVYAAWSVFLSTDGSNTLPAQLDQDWRQWVYDGGVPRVATTADSGDGIWIDPAIPAARAYNQQVIQDFIQNYDVDGIILDRIRFDNNQFGYNPDSLAIYGLTLPTPTDNTFDEARRDAVSNFIQETQTLIFNLKPHVIFGATPVVFGSTDSDTLNTVFQDYPEWSSRTVSTTIHSSGAGILDVMMPQLYRIDPATNNSLVTLIDSKINTANLTLSPIWGSFLADTQGADIAQNICFATTSGTKGWGIFAKSSLEDVANTETGDRFTNIEAYNNAGCGPNVITADATGNSQYTLKTGWDSTPTAEIADLAAAASGIGIQLNWSAPSGAAKYLIYRDTDSNVNPYYANLINKDYNVTTNSFLDIPANGLQIGETYFYRVVTVDGYNNKADSNTPAGVVFAGDYVIVESRNSAGTLTASPVYSESSPFSDTSAKSGNALLSGTGSRFSQTIGRTATFSPAITEAGMYDVYYIIDGGASNASAEANANYTISTNLSGSDSGTFNIDKDVTEFVNDEFVKVNSASVPVNIGAAGSAISITFTNVDGDGAGVAAGNRFVMDSALFLKVAELPATAPTCTAVTLVGTNPTNADSISFTYTFSETVVNFNDAADISLSFTGTVGATGVTITPVSGSVYTVSLTGVTGDGTIIMGANTASDIQDTTAQALASSVSSSAVTVDNIAPGLTAASPTTKVTGNIVVSLANGPETVVSTDLYARLNGGAWSNVGTFSGATFNYNPGSNGNVDFYVVSTDAAGNSNALPVGEVAQDRTVYATTQYDFQLAVAAGTTQLFPMNDLQSVNIDYTNVTTGGTVRVQRILGNAAPAGYGAGDLIDEYLTITGTFTGTASFLWQYNNTGNAGSNTTVYKVNGPTVTPITSGLVFGINSVTVPSLTTFSDWYLGDASANESEWLLLD